MATEVPWTEAAFGQLLDEKLGTDWAEQLKTKWGAEWGESCAQELATKLGDNWADSPQTATDTLVELLDETADPGPEETTDADGTPDVDFDQYEWLKTFTEADSFESWLVRIGMSADDANTIVNADQQNVEEGTP